MSGTQAVLTLYCTISGTDATCMFEDIGHSADARELMKKYYIGRLIK